MNNLEKVKRQLAKPISVMIKNEEGEEDEFFLKRLNIGQQALMMELSKQISSRGETKIDGQKVPNLTKEDMTEMGDLIFDVVKCSMPDLDEETLRQFTSDNFEQLSNALVDLMPKSSGNTDLIKQAREARKNAKSEPETE